MYKHCLSEKLPRMYLLYLIAIKYDGFRVATFSLSSIVHLMIMIKFGSLLLYSFFLFPQQGKFGKSVQ